MTSMADSQSKQQHSTEAAPSLSLCESSNSYAAVIENRAKEVGVAVLHLDSLKLSISQYIEAGRYVFAWLSKDSPCPKCVSSGTVADLHAGQGLPPALSD
jgi:hypothetical protein